MPTDTYVIDSQGRHVIKKDPNAILDYPFDWTDYLTEISDVIQSATFVVDGTSGIEIDSSSASDTIATAFVSGGTAGQEGTLTCRITTVGGRVDDRSVYLTIVNR